MCAKEGVKDGKREREREKEPEKEKRYRKFFTNIQIYKYNSDRSIRIDNYLIDLPKMD